MTQITDSVYAVVVPDNTVHVEIYEKESLPVAIMVFIEDKNKLFKPGIPFPIPLPPGTWQLLCTTKEATRGDAFGLVKSHYSRSASYNPILGHYQTSGSSTTFMDYINGYCTFDNPLDSLRSLLTSKGLDANKNYCLLKKEK